MAAQTVKTMTLPSAKAMVAGGKEVRPGTYALKSRGITVTIQQTNVPGMVKVIIMQGCSC